MTNLLTTTKAAALIGITRGQVRRMCQDARLVCAAKIGRDWLIERWAVELAADNRRIKKANRRKPAKTKD